MSSAFSALTVVEYADFIAGPYCARLLAGLGAAVTKIERPRVGDSARGHGPFSGGDPDRGGVPDRERSGLFLYLGIDKRSVTLDPGTPEGRDLFLRMVSKADVLVEDTAPGDMAQLGLDYPALREVNPGLVCVSISPYGQSGPKARWKARHVNSFHASGEGFTLPGGAASAAFPDRGPVAGGAHLGEYDTGLTAASGAVAALYAREVWGTGQHVDVSKQESTTGLNRLMLAEAAAQGTVTDRTRSYVYGGIFPCSDGFVMVYPREDRQWGALTGLMGQPELSEEERYCTRAARIQHSEAVNRIIGDWAATRTKQEIYDLVAPSGCPVAFYATSEDVYQSVQLEARGFFHQVDHPRAGRVTLPVRPYKVSIDSTPVSPAPLLGQHNEEIFCGELGLSREQLRQLQERGVV